MQTWNALSAQIYMEIYSLLVLIPKTGMNGFSCCWSLKKGWTDAHCCLGRWSWITSLLLAQNPTAVSTLPVHDAFHTPVSSLPNMTTKQNHESVLRKSPQKLGTELVLQYEDQQTTTITAPRVLLQRWTLGEVHVPKQAPRMTCRRGQTWFACQATTELLKYKHCHLSAEPPETTGDT